MNGTDPFVLDLSGTSTDLGGKAPPQGTYKVKIESVEPANNNDGGHAFKVGFVVLDGPCKGSGFGERFNLPNGSAYDSLKKTLLTRLLLSCGLSRNALGNVDLRTVMPMLVSRPAVVYIEDDAERTEKDGRRRYDIFGVLPEEVAAAVAGTWTPRGGKAPQAAPGFVPNQTPNPTPAPNPAADMFGNNGAAPAAAPAAGFDGLFDTAMP